MAVRFTAARPWRRSVAVGKEGEMDLEGRGRGAGAEGERGGEWEAGSRRRRVLAILSPVSSPASEGSVGTRPVPTRVGGTGEGDVVRGLGRLGRPVWLRARGLATAVRVGWAGWSRGLPPLFCFFCNLFLLFIFPFCFI